MNCGIALGSNLGDRLTHLRAARDFLRDRSRAGFLLSSAVYETEPVGCPPGSPTYYNAVVVIDFDGVARELFACTAAYELAHGRDRGGGPNAPRPIDLDLLYAGESRVDDPDLVIPHPRLAGRRFVLEPLAAIMPALVLPGQRHRVAELLARLPGDAGQVRLVAPEW